MSADQKAAHAARMLAHLESQASPAQTRSDADTLPETVRTRIEKMLPTAKIMTPEELREYVTLLCVASFHEGALTAVQDIKGAIAP